MKKKDWPVLLIVSLAAAGLRMAQCRTGFDEAGLPVGGTLSRTALPLVLLLAAVYFTVSARTLPAKRACGVGIAEGFRFPENKLAVACVIAGAFLVLAGGAMSLLGHGALSLPLLVLFGAAGAFCLLYTVFTLYRGGAAQGIALLVPVCALVVYLVFLYRAEASNPVLAAIYVEILTLCVLTVSMLQIAAFAFRDGAPRAYLPTGAMAFVFALTAAAELRSLASVLLLLGCGAVEFGFLAAADFTRGGGAE